MKYLSVQDILVIHALLIDETGGSHGVRDVGLLNSIIHRPQTSIRGREVHENIFEKTAAYFEAIIKYHVFIDGNKRTAVSTAARFLYINGYELKTTNEEIERFTLQVALDKLDIKIISNWFKKNSHKA